jgi:acetyl esterase/lipase
MTIYPAPKDKAGGAAVLVCPGGGYNILAMDLEGTEIAEWLNSAGVTACVLKYRVPAREQRERYAAPLQDAQRAMGLIRQKAKDLGIDPKKVGVMGFSAGAHLSAVLSNHKDERTYSVVDDADQLSTRPDFVMLIYPAYLANKQGVVSPELTISSNTPPTLIVQTQDDSIPVEGALAYYAALKALKVPVEMHLYGKGGHGYGMRPSENAVSDWPKLAERWFRSIGVAGESK